MTFCYLPQTTSNMSTVSKQNQPDKGKNALICTAAGKQRSVGAATSHGLIVHLACPEHGSRRDIDFNDNPGKKLTFASVDQRETQFGGYTTTCPACSAQYGKAVFHVAYRSATDEQLLHPCVDHTMQFDVSVYRDEENFHKSAQRIASSLATTPKEQLETVAGSMKMQYSGLPDESEILTPSDIQSQ